MGEQDEPESELEPVRARAATGALGHMMQLGGVVRQCYATGLGVGRSDFLALGHIYSSGPLQPRELGVLMGMGSGTLTPLLDRLEERGYAVRTRYPRDRRRLLIELSPRGRAVMEAASAEFDEVLSAVMAEAGVAVSLDGFSALLEGAVRSFAARLRAVQGQ
ncbi:hypothetical protein SA2016_4107 (plasmid) [Sinomonas atrocyanea]|uniref:HTH marR-type domain-containing protein n=1 Tax=Sinomonas atrocyanea TaxID=37927 RepID=A0A127A5N6_9MICC|nr:MarR family transcriptional regulator [Sinomonas atrocyanea]AMM34759.1 hypothetical protein SA2016_4107 [Sinomonas atrocyanea]GEB66240.1 hypothetical protein SAT01_36880 [Sinomonas atrocyanea]GGG80093.1 hypothetical protein GCM10007172_36670 [Sinomonas atrocyanea]